MAKTHYESVDEYIAAHPEPVQAILQRVRSAIREAVPKAEEGISYQIPTYKLQGRAVLHFAGWKQHYSLYPAGEQLVLAFQQELAPYEVNDKGTIRLPLSEPVPVKLIERIAKFRAKEMTGRAVSKPAASKKAASKPAISKPAASKPAASKKATSKKAASKKAASKKAASKKATSKTATSKKAASRKR